MTVALASVMVNLPARLLSRYETRVARRVVDQHRLVVRHRPTGDPAVGRKADLGEACFDRSKRVAFADHEEVELAARRVEEQ